MDILSNLKYAKGSRKKVKRIGRGQGSGHGGTSTKGMNGQLSRAGAKKRSWFEGGQMPLQRIIPKRGFNNIFRKEYVAVNVNRLERLVKEGKVTDNTLNPKVMYSLGLISKVAALYKILGDGELTVKLNIEAYACSESAKQKIEAAGGTIKIINS